MKSRDGACSQSPWPCGHQLCPLLADQTEELDSIRRELSKIKAQVDSLLESLESMEQQRDQHVHGAGTLGGAQATPHSPWVPVFPASEDTRVFGVILFVAFSDCRSPLPTLDFISLGCSHGQGTSVTSRLSWFPPDVWGQKSCVILPLVLWSSRLLLGP